MSVLIIDSVDPSLRRNIIFYTKINDFDVINWVKFYISDIILWYVRTIPALWLHHWYLKVPYLVYWCFELSLIPLAASFWKMEFWTCIMRFAYTTLTIALYLANMNMSPTLTVLTSLYAGSFILLLWSRVISYTQSWSLWFSFLILLTIVDIFFREIHPTVLFGSL